MKKPNPSLLLGHYRHLGTMVRAAALLLGVGLALPAWSALTVNAGNGTVTDTATGLVWEQCAQGLSGATCATGTTTTFTWAAALTAASTANTAVYKGFSDWRLPNKNELESIVNIGNSSPAIDSIPFPATPSSSFWTSTTYEPNPSDAWIVGFNYGGTSAYYKTLTNYVRLVRSGQSLASFDALAPVAPPQPPTPNCTLSASPAAIVTGGSSTLTASCDVAVTSYVWSNTGFASSAASGRVAPLETTTYFVAGVNANGTGAAAAATVTVIPQVDVRSYVPAAATGYASAVRVINSGSLATAVAVALIDPATGSVGATKPLIASLASGAATTLTARQIETALGLSLGADARPRLRITGTQSALEVQSLLQQVGGALSDVTGAKAGASVTVSTYIPAAAGSAYASALRVINTGTLNSPVTVALINASTGATSAPAVLSSSLAAGAAATFTSTQVETALGVSLAAGERPRLVVSATNSTLDVQSYLLQPGGALAEVSTGQSGTQVNVRSYVPASVAGYTTYLRIMNDGAKATPVTATVLDEVTGQPLASGTIITSLAANAASTLSAGSIESTLGFRVPATSRPRIQLGTPDASVTLSVQSFLLQPSGVFTEISNAVSNTRAKVRTYYPAAALAQSGATSYLRVINSGSTSSSLIVSLIDPVNGQLLHSVLLVRDFAGGAAKTFSSTEIEAAMGVSLAGDARPRIQFIGSTPLEVQSFLLNSNGVFTEVSGGQ